MLMRYELTDDEWNRIANLLPPENNGKPGRPGKDNRIMLNAMVWIARCGASTKIQALVDAYGYPVCLILSEGQENDIKYAIPLLENVSLSDGRVLGDRSYDSNALIDDIYERGGEPTIPSRKGAKFERHCDWWLYKGLHVVENFFLKLNGNRRVATRYDMLACTYMGFIVTASIFIWIK